MRSVHSASSAFRRLVSFRAAEVRDTVPYGIGDGFPRCDGCACAGQLAAADGDRGASTRRRWHERFANCFDMAYLALNNQLITGIILPIVCGILCSDLVARDYSGGMRTLIACETRGASTYVAAKLVTAAVVCQGVVLLFIAACILVSCLLLDLPIAIEPSAWLASSGPQDSIWAQYGQFPWLELRRAHCCACLGFWGA